MKSNKIMKAGIFATMIALTGIFYACQKDDEKTILSQKKQTLTSTLKERKSLDNFQQPTQIIDIQTFINIGEASFPISGTAVVGNYDGRIYEYDLTGVISVEETDEMVPIHLTAVLKPEFEDFIIDVEPVMENYVTIINEILVTQDVELIFPINTSFIEITYYNILDLWSEIVEICSSNTTIIYPFILDESMLPYQYAVYEHDLTTAFVYMWATLCDYAEGERVYFTLSFYDANNFLHYGFVTESSIHFDSSVFIDDSNNLPVNIDDIDDDNTIMGCKKITTNNEERAKKWCAKKVEQGYNVQIRNNPNGSITCIACKN